MRAIQIAMHVDGPVKFIWTASKIPSTTCIGPFLRPDLCAASMTRECRSPGTSFAVSSVRRANRERGHRSIDTVGTHDNARNRPMVARGAFSVTRSIREKMLERLAERAQLAIRRGVRLRVRERSENGRQ
jgi:hypothetical protein